ncbi:MAG: hypothetical protein FWD17_00090 [Polyangiaceae bacterium]|nr:hypothetical protein [Polyangiaceae bacterium]
MSRIVALACAIALPACVSRGAPAAAAGHGDDARFRTEDQRITACLDLRDHIVDLYATEYVSHEEVDGAPLNAAARTAFRDGWAEELVKRGTFARFEDSCFAILTPRKYACGMQSRSTDGLAACMRLSAR